MQILTRLFLTLFILLPGCAQQKHTTVTDETGAVCPLPLPTVYTADIPCRDCPPTTASLTLRPDSLYDNVARTLLITPTNNLRVVKVSGGIIPPDVNYDLTRDDSNPSYNDVVRIKGMYSYMADAGLFTECLTGATFPVAMEGENAALERAYMNTPHGQAEPILVTL